MEHETQTVHIGKGTAKIILGRKLAWQRPINRQHVRYLSEQMNAGHWHTGLSCITLAYGPWSSMNWVVIDGQHTLNALCECDIQGMQVRAMIVRIDSEDDARKAYLDLNTSRAQSTSDRLRAAGLNAVNISESARIRAVAATLELAKRGISQYSSQQSLRMCPRDIDALVGQWTPYFLRLKPHLPASAVSGGSAVGESAKLVQKLCSARPLAIVFATMTVQEDAERWWGTVVTDAPENAEYDALTNAWIARQVLRNVSGDRKVACEYSRRLAACWRAYVEGRRLTIAKAYKEIQIGEYTFR